MSENPVYLAGPITGLSYDGAQDWREYAIKKLKPIHGLSPLRGKEYLRTLGTISGTGEEYAHLGCLSLPRGVMSRDHFDTTRSRVVLVNLLGAKSVSIGTVMEMAWAFMAKNLVVCAIEDDKTNPHEHMMLTEAISFRVPTLDEAIHVTRAIYDVKAGEQ